MTTRDPVKMAAAVRDAGVPDNLNRWLRMTTAADVEAYEKRLRRITARSIDPHIKNPPRHVSAKASTGLGVPPAFLKRTGARPANTEGDDMSNRKAMKLNRKARRTGAKMDKLKRATTVKKAASAKTSRPDEVAAYITGKGATAAKIGAEFELKEHSVRAIISGLKKPVSKGGRGLDVTAEKNGEGVTVYSIAE